MDMYFFKGIIAGILLGIPAGPLGAIAIGKMITRGPLHGVFFGLGFALVDVIYGSIIGLGVSFISNFMVLNQGLIYLLGGIFLIVIGIKIFFTNPFLDLNTAYDKKEYLGSFTLSFFLALTSPATLLSFTAVFTSFNLGFTSLKSLVALQIITGIVMGGAMWWVVLGFSIRCLKSRIKKHSLKYINRVFGILIIGIVVLLYVYN